MLLPRAIPTPSIVCPAARRMSAAVCPPLSACASSQASLRSAAIVCVLLRRARIASALRVRLSMARCWARQPTCRQNRRAAVQLTLISVLTSIRWVRSWSNCYRCIPRLKPYPKIPWCRCWGACVMANGSASSTIGPRPRKRSRSSANGRWPSSRKIVTLRAKSLPKSCAPCCRNCPRPIPSWSANASLKSEKPLGFP